MQTAQPEWQQRLRVSAFVVLLVFIIGGPFYRQVLGGDSSIFRPWVMFSGAALDAVSVDFYEQQADGSQFEIDWYESLVGTEYAPASRRGIEGITATWEVAQALCEQLGDSADVRARSRRATAAGWQTDYTGETNLCNAPPPVSVGDPGEGLPG